MTIDFKHGVRRNFVEDVVFTFNHDGLIDCIAFGLDRKARTDILGKGVWPIEARQKLMEFLENYKTAYALKSHLYAASHHIVIELVKGTIIGIEHSGPSVANEGFKHVKSIRRKAISYRTKRVGANGIYHPT